MGLEHQRQKTGFFPALCHSPSWPRISLSSWRREGWPLLLQQILVADITHKFVSAPCYSHFTYRSQRGVFSSPRKPQLSQVPMFHHGHCPQSQVPCFIMVIVLIRVMNMARLIVILLYPGRLSRKDGSPKMISLTGLSNSEIFGPPARTGPPRKQRTASKT